MMKELEGREMRKREGEYSVWMRRLKRVIYEGRWEGRKISRSRRREEVIIRRMKEDQHSVENVNGKRKKKEEKKSHVLEKSNNGIRKQTRRNELNTEQDSMKIKTLQNTLPEHEKQKRIHRSDTIYSAQGHLQEGHLQEGLCERHFPH